MQIIVDLHNWGKLRLDMITVFQNLKGYYLEKIQDDILAEIARDCILIEKLRSYNSDPISSSY